MTDYQHIKLTPADAEIYPLEIRGRFYFLESHSLNWCAKAVTQLGDAMDFGKVLAPVFPRYDFGPCRTLVLNVTHSCNLRCAYCFVRAAGHPSDHMSSELALRAIGELFPPASNPTIGFFGGEPLLEWELIQDVVKFCTSNYSAPKFALTTNGTLLDAGKAAFLALHKFSVILSIDGDSARHDRLRPFANGQGSYPAALSGLKDLARAGVQPLLRSTFGASGIDLVAELEALNRLCDEGMASGVSVEPVSLAEGCAFSREGLRPGDLKAMEAQYLSAAGWFCDRAREGMHARFHHLTKTLERLLLKTPFCSECGAGNGYLTLNAAGELHACHREQSLVGKMEASGIAWDASRRAWLDNRLECHEGCPSCGLRYLCGGGCRYDAMLASDDLRRPNPLTCELQRLRLMMALRVLDEIGMEAAAKAADIDLSHAALVRSVGRCKTSATGTNIGTV